MGKNLWWIQDRGNIVDDNVEVTGDIEGFFLDYESGAMADAYDIAMLKQQKAFKRSCKLQDIVLQDSITNDTADDFTVDASED